MGLYNFQKRFAPMILSGEKQHTIRAVRKHPDKPGNTMHLFTGLRTKKTQLLMRVPCVKVDEIVIEMQKAKGPGVLTRGLLFPHVLINGEDLSRDELEALARSDGFRNFPEMILFWREPKNRLPFKGHIIYWRFDLLEIRGEICAKN